MVGLLVGGLVGLLVCWLVGWLVGGWVVRSVGWFARGIHLNTHTHILDVPYA